MRCLWSLGCVNVVYIDDAILLSSPRRLTSTLRLTDCLNVCMGMECSMKPEARQDSRLGVPKLLGLNYQPFRGNFLVLTPKAKERKAKQYFTDIQNATNLVTNKKFLTDPASIKPLALKSMEQALGMFGHLEEARPSQIGRCIIKSCYWWCIPRNFHTGSRNHKKLKQLFKVSALAKEMVDLGTPNILGKLRANLPRIVVLCDAAGIEDDSPQIACLVIGLPGGPRWMEKAMSIENTDLDPNSEEDRRLYDSVKGDIQFWEMVAATEILRELGDQLENHWIRFKVDNSGELFGFISPSSNDSPIHVNIAFSWRMTLTAKGIIPSLGYVASPRNISDLWTRRNKTTREVTELEKHCIRVGAGNKISIKHLLTLTIDKMLQQMREMDAEYRVRFNIPPREPDVESQATEPREEEEDGLNTEADADLDIERYSDFAVDIEEDYDWDVWTVVNSEFN